MTWTDPKANPNCCNAFLKVKDVWFCVSAALCPIVRYVDEVIPSIGTSEQIRTRHTNSPKFGRKKSWHLCMIHLISWGLQTFWEKINCKKGTRNSLFKAWNPNFKWEYNYETEIEFCELMKYPLDSSKNINSDVHVCLGYGCRLSC